jgi:histidinol-phosphatase (PHP family)
MNFDQKSDFHMHTVFSDGVAQLDEMVSAAIEKGLEAITITDHMPLPFENRYAMRAEDIGEYRRQIRLAQRKYEGRIVVKMGLEFEYLQPFAKHIHSISSLGWDHLLVSVHSLFINHHAYMTNGTEDEFNTLVERFDHNLEKVCRRYYETLQLAAQTGLFDIVGHLDVIKKHNQGEHYFSENSPWYKALVRETLDLIKQNGMKMEINMAGFNHPAGEQYPSKWIIQEAVKRDIQLVLSSDSHKPESLGQHFYKIDDLLLPSTRQSGDIGSKIGILKAS